MQQDLTHRLFGFTLQFVMACMLHLDCNPRACAWAVGFVPTRI